MRGLWALVVSIGSLLVVVNLAPDPQPHGITDHALAARHIGTVESEASTAPRFATTESRLSEVDRVFNTSALGPRQASWARDVLGGGCDYTWSDLEPRLAGRRITIQLGEPAARAMYYPNELRIVVHRYYYRNERTEASRLLPWESAHAADLLSMTEEQRHRVTDLYHPHEDDDHRWLEGQYDHQVGEAFMEGFVAAFCPSLATEARFEHVTTPEIAAEIREIL